jgi:hypothetical protein
MMHHDRSLAPTRGSAYPTTVAVALQDSLTEAAEVFLILPLECVTRRTEAMGECHAVLKSRTAAFVFSTLDLRPILLPFNRGQLYLKCGQKRQEVCP